MASVPYCQHLTCSICLSIFTDPVTLLCGHSFCRMCITDARNTQRFCPECRTPLPQEETRLPTSHILKNLAEKARNTKEAKVEHEFENEEVANLCPEHDEKLKLFCVTDQQLACVICRDGATHQQHIFKPVEEAVVSLRKELEALVQRISNDVGATENLANNQSEEITKTKEKSKQLMTHICKQFKEMHEFLRKREEQIKTDLKHKAEDAVQKMTKTLNAIETAVTESLVLEVKVASALEITDTYKFLKWWCENNSEPPEHLFRPRAKDFQLVKTYLSLGPHESHLQFFVWKEMLQVIQPRAELLSLRRNSTDITVSDDGRSLFCTPKSMPPHLYPSLVHNPITGHGQTKHSPLFSPHTGFGQLMAIPSLTSGARFGQTQTNPQFGSGARFGQTQTNPQFDSGARFGQTQTNPQFGSGAGLVQTTSSPSFYSNARFGQTRTNPPFTSGMGFVQTTSTPSFSPDGGFGQFMANPSFGPSAGFGQTIISDIYNAFSVDEFYSGHHYWEVDVGHREYWELGIKNTFLKYDGRKYSTCNSNIITELQFEGRPRKIGIYLNCSSKKVSFYDADNMTHIHTVISRAMPSPMSAYFNIRYRAPDPNPMTVCWY
ncbi:nuclear factor 7, ovary-like [Solea senegalensis]|uniref:Nuclear factor 7, ovary-like n=1 Tax=Solea senegalensis TaxID=28829 RepID=A0AAV6SSJ8_SOLSE|nr:zinc-binding protein A33-like [Solea senegalensis]KAG7519992.1 nuclear factor 7, ovary-like [Solea senegalensis]